MIGLKGTPDLIIEKLREHIENINAAIKDRLINAEKIKSATKAAEFLYQCRNTITDTDIVYSVGAVKIGDNNSLSAKNVVVEGNKVLEKVGRKTSSSFGVPSMNQLKDSLEKGHLESIQEIINRRLRYVTEVYNKREEDYTTFYGSQLVKFEGKDVTGMNMSLIQDRLKKHDNTIGNLYNQYHDIMTKKYKAKDRAQLYLIGSKKQKLENYINMRNKNIEEALSLYKETEANSKKKSKGYRYHVLYAIYKVDQKLFMTSLSANEGHLYEAMLHAASMLKVYGEENLLTKYQQSDVIHFDYAMLKSKGTEKGHRGGDVTFNINGRNYAIQAKKSGSASISLKTIKNGLQDLLNIVQRLKNLENIDIESYEKFLNEINNLFNMEISDLSSEVEKNIINEINRNIKAKSLNI